MDHDLIERFRDINVDYEWWHAVHEDFHGICYTLGITLGPREPCFSGFACQGDGASFAGLFTPEKIEEAPAAIRNYAPLDEELHRIADALCATCLIYYKPTLTIMRDPLTRYLHSNSMIIENVEPTHGDVDDWADEVHEAIYGEMRTLMRDLANWLYKTLEAEHDYLTGDEAVWETITANELDKQGADL